MFTAPRRRVWASATAIATLLSLTVALITVTPPSYGIAQHAVVVAQVQAAASSFYYDASTGEILETPADQAKPVTTGGYTPGPFDQVPWYVFYIVLAPVLIVTAPIWIPAMILYAVALSRSPCGFGCMVAAVRPRAAAAMAGPRSATKDWEGVGDIIAADYSTPTVSRRSVATARSWQWGQKVASSKPRSAAALNAPRQAQSITDDGVVSNSAARASRRMR